jgi:PST family polysaccharide transporter
LVTQGVTFVSYVVLARILVPADFGRFAAGSILVGFGMLFVDSGMLAALVSRRERVEEAANTALVATIVGGVALGLAGLVASPLVALYFRDREIGFVAAAMSASFILRQATIVPNAILQRNLSFFRRVVCEPAAACAFGATAIAASIAGVGVWSLVIGQYASYATDVVLSWILVPWRPDLSLASLATWRELIGFGKFVTFAELMERTSSEASTALVGRFIGAHALGQYQYAYRIAARPATALTDSISYVLYPALARISGDQPRFRAAVLRALRWTTVVAFPASLIFLPLGEPLVVTLLGDEWREAGRAVEAMCAFTAGAALMSLAAHVAAAAGRPEVVFRVQVVNAFLIVSSMIALLHFGVIGVAIGLSVATLATGAYSAVWLSRMIQAPATMVFHELLPPAAAAIIMAVAVYPVDHEVLTPVYHGTGVAVLLLLLEGMFALAIFITVLGALAPDTIREFVAGVRTRRSPRTASGVSS